MCIINVMKKEFLIYDLETFGLSPAHDRIAQFAARRYNSVLEPIDEGIILYCKIPQDYLPSPTATLVTGITPDFVNKNGLCEVEFAKKIFKIMNEKSYSTYIVGYNNTKFDDNMLRYLFFRNFISPFSTFLDRSIDVYTLMKAVYFVKKDIFKYKKNEQGRDSLRLEHLTLANGFEHKSAHDALSDVEATAQVFFHIIKNTPSVYEKYLFTSSRNSLYNFIVSQGGDNLFFLQTANGIKNSNGTLAINVVNCNNECYFFDLLNEENEFEKNLEILKSIKDDYKNSNNMILDYNKLYSCSIKIKLNASPFISTEDFFYSNSNLAKNEKEEIKLEVEKRLKRFKEVWSLSCINEKKSFEKPINQNSDKDVDESIYDGFLDKETSIIRAIDTSNPAIMYDELKKQMKECNEKRLRVVKLFSRLIARNYFDVLSDKQKENWKNHCKEKLLVEKHDSQSNTRTLAEFDKELEGCKNLYKDDAKKMQIIALLDKYAKDLVESLQNF